MATKRVTIPGDAAILRNHLLNLLNGDGAHVEFDAAVQNFPQELRGKRPAGAVHTAWQLLEHLRITQTDVLESLRNPKHVSPEFPDGYWPKTEAPPDRQAWEASIVQFRADLSSLKSILEDESSSLFSELPNSGGQTIARRLLMIADHNSYHLGQFVLLRRLLGAWPTT